MIDTTNLGKIFILIIICTIIVQFLTERTTDLLPEGLYNKLKQSKYFNSAFIAFFYGIVISYIARLDMFTALGVPSVSPFIDYFLTGIIISGGSTFVNSLFNAVSGVYHTGDDVDKALSDLSKASTVLNETDKMNDNKQNTVQDNPAPVSSVAPVQSAESTSEVSSAASQATSDSNSLQ